MKLTKTMRKALEMLSRTVCHTANCGYGESTIAGNIAKLLVDGGIAEYISGWQLGPNHRNDLTRVRITETGRAELERLRSEESTTPAKQERR